MKLTKPTVAETRALLAHLLQGETAKLSDYCTADVMAIFHALRAALILARSYEWELDDGALNLLLEEDGVTLLPRPTAPGSEMKAWINAARCVVLGAVARLVSKDGPRL